jgi:DNA-binding MarR family transcriptional regulator
MSSLSRELGVSLSAMTQVADRLERANLVQRVAAGTDRRIKRLQLTPRGEKIMRAREQSRIQRVRVALENASPKARKEILNGLEMFVDACGKVKRQEIGGGRA